MRNARIVILKEINKFKCNNSFSKYNRMQMNFMSLTKKLFLPYKKVAYNINIL